jgi:hypothetical protein
MVAILSLLLIHRLTRYCLDDGNVRTVSLDDVIRASSGWKADDQPQTPHHHACNLRRTNLHCPVCRRVEVHQASRPNLGAVCARALPLGLHTAFARSTLALTVAHLCVFAQAVVGGLLMHVCRRYCFVHAGVSRLNVQRL